VLKHAPYSPDLAPCDFFLFSKLKSLLKGTHFQSTEDSHMKMTKSLKVLSQNYFRGCFKAWKAQLKQCIDPDGNYFEEDNI